MTGYLVVAIVLAWLLATVWLLITGIEGYWPARFRVALAAILVIAGLGTIVQASIDENSKGPCVEYETRMHFNTATKTMMPMRVCVLRGEWITK